MRRSHHAMLLCAGLSLLASPMPAQSVTADVVVRSRPVSGRVVVGDRYRERDREVVLVRRVPARRVMVERERPRVIVVERFRDHGRGWRHHRHEYRMVTVYYARGRYYDRYDRRYPGLVRVVVYERNGRFYRDD